MGSKTSFRSVERFGRRLILKFETILDLIVTDVETLRAMVAEFDRLELPGDHDVILRHRSDRDELGPVGWALTTYAPELGEDELSE